MGQKFNLKQNEGLRQFFNFSTNHRHHQGINEIIENSKSVQKLSPIVAKLRVIKSDAEVSVMKRACEISSVAINRAMATVGSDDPINSENTLARYLGISL